MCCPSSAFVRQPGLTPTMTPAHSSTQRSGKVSKQRQPGHRARVTRMGDASAIGPLLVGRSGSGVRTGALAGDSHRCGLLAKDWPLAWATDDIVLERHSTMTGTERRRDDTAAMLVKPLEGKENDTRREPQGVLDDEAELAGRESRTPVPRVSHCGIGSHLHDRDDRDR